MRIFPLVFGSVTVLLAPPTDGAEPLAITSTSLRLTSSNLNDVRSSRILQAVDSGNLDDEERGTDYEAIEQLIKKEILGEQKQLGELLAHEKLAGWVQKKAAADETSFEAAMISSLVPHFEIDGLGEKLMAATRAKGVKDNAFRFQLEFWLTHSPSDTVFKSIQSMNDDPSKMLMMWVTYVDAFNLKNNAHMSSFKTLKKHFDDKTLFKILEAARQDEETAEIAKKFQQQQLESWRIESKSPDDVLSFLSFDELEGLLDRPQFIDWVKYTDDYASRMEVGDKALFLIATLRKNFADDALAAMLSMAEKVESTKAIAQRLEADLLLAWATESMAPKSMTPDVLFQRLKLEKVGSDVFSSPNFGIFTKYLSYFNRAQLGKKTTLLSLMEQFYSSEIVAKILANKKTHQALRQSWLDVETTPLQAFKALRFEHDPTVLMKNPLFEMWFRYADDFDHHFPRREKMTAIDTLVDVFNEAAVLHMVVTASKVEETKDVAARLLESLLRKMAAEKKHPWYMQNLLFFIGMAEETTVANRYEQIFNKMKSASPPTRVRRGRVSVPP